MRDLYNIRSGIKRRMAEIERLRELADSLSSADPSREFISGGTHGRCRFADAVNEIVTLEGEIADEVREYIATEKALRSYIKSVENPRHRDFLWYKHICMLTMEQIAEKMGLSTRQIYNIQEATSLYFNDFCGILYTEEEAQ